MKRESILRPRLCLCRWQRQIASRHCSRSIGALLVLTLSLLGAEAQTHPQFVDVARQAGVDLPTLSGSPEKDHIVESSTGGLAAFDYDNDGDVDLFVVNGSRLDGFPAAEEPRAALYRNEGDWHFSDIGAEAGVDHSGWGMGCTAADYDADGWTDLYLSNYGPNALFRNDGGQFIDVAAKIGVANPAWSMAATFADYDGDGDLDFYLTNYIDFDPNFRPENPNFCRWRGLDVFCGPLGLAGAADAFYRNEGPEKGWSFTEASRELGLPDYRYYGYGALSGDYDNDGDLDIYIANDATPNILYINEAGRFRDIAPLASCAYSENGLEQASMGAATSDFDGDGDLDLFVTNFSYDNNTLYQNSGRGFFLDASFVAGLGAPIHKYLGWGANFFDADNDGDEDLFVANGHVYPAVDQHPLGTRYAQPNQLFENRGGGRFADISTTAGPGLRIEESSRGSAVADFDDDGDLDIAVVNIDAPPTLLRNDGGNRQNWLMLELRDTGFNKRAVGARVVLTNGDRRQLREVRVGTSYLSQDDLRLHFGLGKEAEVEHLAIRWPNGDEEILRHIAANRLIRVERGKGIVSARLAR